MKRGKKRVRAREEKNCKFQIHNLGSRGEVEERKGKERKQEMKRRNERKAGKKIGEEEEERVRKKEEINRDEYKGGDEKEEESERPSRWARAVVVV